ncbi:hypothetical protein [Vibrio atlanticus]|uniref:hypothetical protein n=1 Tax=Vibrio atlanticus TaxID=693153 RepID=UPI0035540F60
MYTHKEKNKTFTQFELAMMTGGLSGIVFAIIMIAMFWASSYINWLYISLTIFYVISFSLSIHSINKVKNESEIIEGKEKNIQELNRQVKIKEDNIKKIENRLLNTEQAINEANKNLELKRASYKVFDD